MEARRLLTEPGILDGLPAVWQNNVLDDLKHYAQQHKRITVVLDDTLTGAQALPDVPVLTSRSVEAFTAEFERGANSMVVLMNTRNLSPGDARALYQRVTRNLLEAQQHTRRPFTIVSRGESNLLGHFPDNFTAVSAVMPSQFDGVLFVPALSNSYTVNNTHYLLVDGEYVPASQTPYAGDYAFGYDTSNLREWIAQKTGGTVPAESVASISIETIRRGGANAVRDQLMSLENSAFCVVNAAHRRDLDVVALGARLAEEAGKQFYYRGSSEFAAALSGIAPKPVLNPRDLHMGDGVGGLVVVGSHVQRSTEQLIALLASGEVTGIEVRVESLLHDESQRAKVARCSDILETALQHSDVVLYTSRRIIGADDPIHAQIVTQRVNTGLVSILNGVRARPRYVLVKGSITASDIVTRSLNVKRAVAAGEVAPDVLAWTIGNGNTGLPKRTFMIAPGTVGEQDTLLHLVRSLR